MSQIATERRPATLAALPKITYEEFLERYDGIRAEWVDGEVELMSPVSNVHQRIGNFLFRVITEFVEQQELGEVFQLEFQMKLTDEKRGREPAIFFVPKARLTQLRSSYFDGPGDLVVEIISPESVERDRVKKFGEYEQAGVREYWLIDPIAREAKFFRLDEKGRYQAAPSDAEGLYHSAVLEGLWLKIDWLWQSPPPPMSAVRRELGLP